jgi:signal transduction histidine kinase/streptogramin lyase
MMILCALSVNNLLYSQAYDFTQYGIEEGIAHEQVTDICQDVKGNLWIATQGGGVSKFNGLTFQNYTVRDGLLSNYVRKLTTDDYGNVWVATAAGISKFNGDKIENDHTMRYAANKSVNSILIDTNDNLWFASTEQGISFIGADESIHTFNESNGFVNDRVIDIKEDRQGRIWIVTIVNGLYEYKDGAFTKVISTSDVKGYILSITPKDDRLLVTTNRGVFEYNGRLTMLEHFDTMFIKSAISRDEELWLITANSLILHQNGKNQIFSIKEGFSTKLANIGFVDREGNLWIGTNGDGLYKFTNSAFVKFDSRHGLVNEDVLTIIKDEQDNYWYGTNGGGLYKYDGQQMHNFTNEDGLPNNYITSSAIGNDHDLWFGTRGGGIVNYDGSSFHNYNQEQGLIHNSIRTVYQSKDGNVWVATINGVSKWDGQYFESYSTKNGLFDNVVWNIFEYRDKTYFVTRQGINLFENGKMRGFYQNKEVFNKRVNSIRLSTNDNLLIGYSGYGFRIMDPKGNTLVWISKEDGLVSDIIHDIEPIDEEHILVTTERGIDLLTLKDDALVSISHMANKKYGLGLAKTNHGAILNDDSNIWVGTQEGVYCYRSILDRKVDVPPIINISEVSIINDENSNDNFKDRNPFEFKYTQNSIGISYFGNFLNDADNIVYQYKLTDFQSEWSLSSKSNSTMFTNLPSGDYVFQVRARNSDRMFSETPAIFNFRIVPPIWQRSWFYLLMTLLIVVLTRSLYLFKIRANINSVLELEKVRADEATKVRKSMARDFHDNMGNQLASITVFSSLISLKLKNKTEEIDDLLKNIEKHSKSLYNGTKDFIWSMNPESDNLNEIFIYIKDFGEDLFQRTDIAFYADNEVQGQKVEVPSGWSRQIVLIFKEAMTNSLKHSQSQKLYISLQLDNGSFVMKSSDDGRGINNQKVKKGNGYRNMNSRAKQIGCDLVIENKIGELGLEVTLSGVIPEKDESVGIKIF